MTAGVKNCKKQLNRSYQVGINSSLSQQQSKMNKSKRGYELNKKKSNKLDYCEEEQTSSKPQISSQSFTTQAFQLDSKNVKRPFEVYNNVLTEQKQKSYSLDFCKQKNLIIFKNLYAQLGPNWTQISRILKQKYQIFLQTSVNNLKNFFFNSLRRLGKRLEHQTRMLGRKATKESKSYLLSFLEIANQLENFIEQMGLTINLDCLIIKFKNLALNLCFDNALSDDLVKQLAILTRLLAVKMKCYRIFRLKNKKSWKMKPQSLLNIQQFDKIVLQSRQQISRTIFKVEQNEQNEQLSSEWIKIELRQPKQVQLRLIEQNDIEKEEVGLNAFDNSQKVQSSSIYFLSFNSL